MAFSLTCPHCRAILKSASSIPGGKTVRCAKCGQAFETPALEDATAVSEAPPRLLPLEPNDPPAKPAAPAEVPILAAAPDDEPRRSPKRRDDADDPPRRRKRDDDQGDDREYDDEAPSRKPKKQKSNALGITVGFAILGIGFLAIGCVGCGALGYWMYTIFGRHPIVGTWEQTNNPLGARVINKFEANGKGSVQLVNVTVNYRYRVEGNTLTLEPDQAVQGLNAVERYTMQINGDNMTLTRLDNIPFALRELRFRRLR